MLALSDKDDKVDKISPWDGSPIKASLFLRDIGEYASQCGMLTLLLQGWFVNKTTIVTANADIIIIVKDHYADPLTNTMPTNIQEPPNPPIPATRTSTYNPTTEDKKLFIASPELFMAQSQVVLEAILHAISNPDVKRRVRTMAKGDARMALVEIAIIRRELTSAQISHHLQKINQFAKTGRHLRCQA